MPGVITRCETELWDGSVHPVGTQQPGAILETHPSTRTRGRQTSEAGGPLPALKGTSENRCAECNLEHDPPRAAAGDVMDFSGHGSHPGGQNKTSSGASLDLFTDDNTDETWIRGESG